MRIDLALGLTIAAVVVASLGAAASIDQLVKQIPTRHRIGVIAYSTYSRSSDYHYGLFWYLPVVAAWVVLLPAAAIVGLADDPGPQRAMALTIMVTGLVGHMLVTALRAAPILLSQRRVPSDDELALTTIFNQFQRWHLARTLIDVVVLGAAIWALIATITTN